MPLLHSPDTRTGRNRHLCGSCPISARMRIFYTRRRSPAPARTLYPSLYQHSALPGGSSCPRYGNRYLSLRSTRQNLMVFALCAGP